MDIIPFKTFSLGERMLVTNDAGNFFFGSSEIVQRLKENSIAPFFERFLFKKNFAFNNKNSLEYSSYAFNSALRRLTPNKLKYILVIPTLRCDLSCTYCQVSRASIKAKSFDWCDETVDRFIDFVNEYADTELKIEFQGGEPTLGLDLIKKIVDEVSKIRPSSTFIICTNLQNYSKELKNILHNKNVQISTSLDGSKKLHTQNRTKKRVGPTQERWYACSCMGGNPVQMCE